MNRLILLCAVLMLGGVASAQQPKVTPYQSKEQCIAANHSPGVTLLDDFYSYDCVQVKGGWEWKKKSPLTSGVTGSTGIVTTGGLVSHKLVRVVPACIFFYEDNVIDFEPCDFDRSGVAKQTKPCTCGHICSKKSNCGLKDCEGRGR